MFGKLSSCFFALAFFCLFACQNQGKQNLKTSTTPSNRTGEAIFSEHCKLCHGADGRLGLNGAKDLTASRLPLSERLNIITHGKNLMTAFGPLLNHTEIDSVAAYTLKLSQITPYDK